MEHIGITHQQQKHYNFKNKYMKKLILVSLICLFGFISQSNAQFIYRVKVRFNTNEGWVRDTL
jgi:hypothetical protein